MNKIFLLICLTSINLVNFDSNQPPGNIALLKQYKHLPLTATDAIAGKIYKESGTTIMYEIGMQQGQLASSSKINQYLWYKEQTINKSLFKCALTKEMRLIITVPMSDKPNTSYAANFQSNIKKQEDIADVLLIVLTFDPSAL